MPETTAGGAVNFYSDGTMAMTVPQLENLASTKWKLTDLEWRLTVPTIHFMPSRPHCDQFQDDCQLIVCSPLLPSPALAHFCEGRLSMKGREQGGRWGTAFGQSAPWPLITVVASKAKQTFFHQHLTLRPSSEGNSWIYTTITAQWKILSC